MGWSDTMSDKVFRIILNSDTFVHAPCGNQLQLTGLACLNKVFYLSKFWPF